MAPAAPSKPTKKPEVSGRSVPPKAERTKKAAAAAGDSLKRKSRHSKHKSYRTYIRRVFADVAPGMTIGTVTMKTMCALVEDVFDRVATTAARLAKNNGHTTVSYLDAKLAAHLTLPGDLGHRAALAGMEAVTNYKTSHPPPKSAN